MNPFFTGAYKDHVVENVVYKIVELGITTPVYDIVDIEIQVNIRISVSDSQ